jgi:hypothetical protein
VIFSVLISNFLGINMPLLGNNDRGQDLTWLIESLPNVWGCPSRQHLDFINVLEIHELPTTVHVAEGPVQERSGRIAPSDLRTWETGIGRQYNLLTFSLEELMEKKNIRNRLRDLGIRSRRPYVGLPLNDRRSVRLDWLRRFGPYRFSMRRWRNVLFTDESRFTLQQVDGRKRVYRHRGELYADACVDERGRFGGGSFMVWGASRIVERCLLLW